MNENPSLNNITLNPIWHCVDTRIILNSYQGGRISLVAGGPPPPLNFDNPVTEHWASLALWGSGGKAEMTISNGLRCLVLFVGKLRRLVVFRHCRYKKSQFVTTHRVSRLNYNPLKRVHVCTTTYVHTLCIGDNIRNKHLCLAKRHRPDVVRHTWTISTLADYGQYREGFLHLFQGQCLCVFVWFCIWPPSQQLPVTLDPRDPPWPSCLVFVTTHVVGGTELKIKLSSVVGAISMSNKFCFKNYKTPLMSKPQICGHSPQLVTIIRDVTITLSAIMLAVFSRYCPSGKCLISTWHWKATQGKRHTSVLYGSLGVGFLFIKW